MRWIEAATERTAIARLLAKHGVAPTRPPEPRASDALGSASAALPLRQSARAHLGGTASEINAKDPPILTLPTGIACEQANPRPFFPHSYSVLAICSSSPQSGHKAASLDTFP